MGNDDNETIEFKSKKDIQGVWCIDYPENPVYVEINRKDIKIKDGIVNMKVFGAMSGEGTEYDWEMRVVDNQVYIDEVMAYKVDIPIDEVVIEKSYDLEAMFKPFRSTNTDKYTEVRIKDAYKSTQGAIIDLLVDNTKSILSTNIANYSFIGFENGYEVKVSTSRRGLLKPGASTVITILLEDVYGDIVDLTFYNDYGHGMNYTGIPVR